MARLRTVPKGQFTVFLARARQHERQLSVALEHSRWDAVGLSAVHLVISSVDAVTCARLGKVWSGEDHGGVVDLLGQTGASGLEVTVRQVASVLEAKTRVEYGAEPATATGASIMAVRAKRVFDWAVAELAAEAAP